MAHRRAKALLDEAHQLMERKDWEEAKERFRKVAQKLTRQRVRPNELKPLLTQALTGWARCLLEQGQMLEALKIARRALHLIPASEEVQHLYLNTLMALGKWREAERQVKKLLAHYSANWRLHLWAAQIDVQLDRWSDALAHLVAALRLAGDRPEPYEVAAQILERRGETRRAIALLQKGVERSPQSAGLWFILGQLQRNTGQLRDAMKSFEQVLALGGDMPPLREMMGQICMELGWTDKAIEHALKGLEKDTDNLNLLDLLAFAYLQRGQTREAMQVLGRLARLAPTDPVVQFKMATLHHQLSHYAQAVKGYRQTMALAPNTELAREAQNALELLDRYQLEQVFVLSMEDPIFRTKLIRDPLKAVQEKGFALSDASMEIIHNTDFSRLPKRWGSSPGHMYELRSETWKLGNSET